MLELRLTADEKKIAAMHLAIERECERSKTGPDHVARVALIVEQLVGVPEPRGRGRSRRARTPGDVFVIVTVQSDATMLIVRDTRPEHGGLGQRRQQVLEDHTSSWSTMSGPDGRTVWAEIARAVAAPQPRRDGAARPTRNADVREPAPQAISPPSPRRTSP
ncbi:MAG: hypothetical protein QOG59_2653, partial [Solirubrobacteraceae bacterium]|nr:hypothetical protein [Solirubrobacteraceae bacterium]